MTFSTRERIECRMEFGDDFPSFQLQTAGGFGVFERVFSVCDELQESPLCSSCRSSGVGGHQRRGRLAAAEVLPT